MQPITPQPGVDCAARLTALPPDISLRWLVWQDADAARFEALLSEEEARRLSEIRHTRARQHFMLGRAALRALVGERLGVKPVDAPLNRAADGGVDIGAEEIYGSITHAANYAVAVVGAKPIGVDLERIQPRAHGLAKFIFLPEERAMYDLLPVDRTRAVVLCWTLKEAVLKAARFGLRYSAKACRLVIDYPAQRAQATVQGDMRFECRFVEQAGFYLSLAWADRTAVSSRIR